MRHAFPAATVRPRDDAAARDASTEEPETAKAPEQSSAEDTSTEASVSRETNSPDAKRVPSQADSGRWWSEPRLALAVGVFAVLALGTIGCWLGWQRLHLQQAAAQRTAFVQAARQGALNVTTIDWRHSDADVQRILDSATGAFYDDFSKRSAPFIDVVKQTQSTSKGTVVSAAIQTEAGDTARVLVAVKVDVSNTGAEQQPPRSWRMQLTVQKVGDDVKVSDVEFVP
jgi:Mce-associated membrane protein